MKRVWIFCLLPALLLTGCGFMMEENKAEDAGEAVSVPVSPETLRDTFPAESVDVVPAEEPADFNDITDEDALRRLYSTQSNAELIPGYFQPAECQGDYSFFIPPETGDIPTYLQTQGAGGTIELLADSETYCVYNCRELDPSPAVLSNQMHLGENGFAFYDGEFNESSVLTAFDMLAKDKKILARWYKDDPEIKCIAYDFYAVEDKGDGTAELGWYCYLIDRDDHMFSIQPEWNQKRTIELHSASGGGSETVPEVFTSDIELTLEKKELLIGRDEPEIVVRAVLPAACSPESVQLYDADTGEVLCDLYDDCDYAAHGDDIQGDGWYCNRYTVNTDIDTDPNVSEDVTYRFYAEFTENGVTHRSETAELFVSEGFADKELEEMDKVDQTMNELMESDAWKQANTVTRRDLAVNALKELAEEGLVIPESILAQEDMISYQYACGISGGIMLTPFDPYMN